ncbi:MAG: hypothetical protein NZL92_07105 [Gloeomargarita sp. SKYG116]|nr:hypothetical protein [Gloeomargarita sp. SKYG116]MDW8401446.1 hypothetical protein [Gloeomargarita sp. SKYGB_i_bin116]
MTLALCFHCGGIKFGALCPCEHCGVGATSDISLDIVFSDHHYAVETLEEFGAVIREINRHTTDPMTRFWAFIAYVATYHPSILAAEMPEEMRARVENILRQCTLPTVTLRPTYR